LFNSKQSSRAHKEVTPSTSPEGTLQDYSYISSSTEPEKTWANETPMSEIIAAGGKEKQANVFCNKGFEQSDIKADSKITSM